MVWLGPAFPWLNALAIVSAARCGGFDRIVLHTDCPPAVVLAHRGLAALATLELRPVDLSAIAGAAERDVASVRRLYDAMSSAAARSDILRALLLAGEGGVYLDMDTVTVASFSELRSKYRAFVGQERICFPDRSQEPESFGFGARACLLSAARYMLARAPNGYRAFEKISRHYALSVNNAVIGCEAHHPFIQAYVTAMLELPLAVAARRYGVGPHLLARVCRAVNGEAVVVGLLEPAVFYPLPPVISEQWWRTVQEPVLHDVLSRETVAVHWYASVRSKKLARSVDHEYVSAHQNSQLFAKLAARFLPDC